MLLKQVEELKAQIKATEKMDEEGVHQMRVASRRLRAGLPIFSSCFKEGQYERWRGSIKGITGALGEARDTDVQIVYLRSFLEKTTEQQRPGVQALLDKKLELRRDQQESILGWLDNLKDEGSLEEMEEKLSKVEKQLKSKDAEVRSRASYAAGMANVNQKVEKALKLEGCIPDPQARLQHHALRIAMKRLRYTAEAFRPLFDDQLKPEITALKGVQDLLGEMHDCDVWLASMDQIAADLASDCGDRAAIMPGLDAIKEDREKEHGRLHSLLVERWHELRAGRFFEKLGERFQAGLSNKDIPLPIMDTAHGPAKIAIISDVHGNLDALDAVMEDARKHEVGAFINLGDMVGSGAYPEEVVKKLSGDHVLSVAGNFDLKVLEFSRASKRPRVRSVKGAVVAAAARDLSEDSISFIASLPPEIRLEVLGKRILMVHASPADPDEHLDGETPESRLKELADISDADIVLVGHSHKPFVRQVGDVLFANPGSVGRPGDHDPRASYAILDTKDFSVEVYRVEYDIEAAVRAIQEKGLPPVLGDVLRKGLSSNEVQGERKRPPRQGVGKLEEVEVVARKLNMDHPHSEQVLKLAALMFRDLKTLHGLSGKDRFLLEAGCLLHDIGFTEGRKGHHWASYRMIMEQKLPLNPQDKRMVACLARYHRKRPPKDGDPELSGLDKEEVERMTKLAAMLRVADGLDYRHEGIVKSIECQVGPESVVIKLDASSDPSLEVEAATSKADLFQEVFAREVRFE